MTATVTLIIRRKCTHLNLLKSTLYLGVITSILLLLWIRSSYYKVNTSKLRPSTQNVSSTPVTSSNQSTTTRQQWPPIDENQLLDSKTGRYNLALRPRVVSRRIGHRRPWLQRYYQLLTTLYPGSIANGSLVYRGYQMEQVLRIDSKAYNYHLYPQLVDLEGVVKAIRSGKSIESEPINDPPLFVVRSPFNICESIMNSSTRYDLLVFIKSCVRCYQQREHARQTFIQRKLWGNFDVKFIFVTGLPPTNYTGAFHFDGIQLQFRGHGNHKNDTTDARKKLIDEATKYGDLLIGEFDDHYYSLTTKQLFTFRWASAFCNGLSDLFLFMDDDMAVIPQNLIRSVQDLPKSIRGDLVLGKRNAIQSVVRSNSFGRKWTVSQKEFPWPIYAPFVSGPAYILGQHVLADVAIALSFHSPFRLEDTNLGHVLFKLRKPVYGRFLFAPNPKEPKTVNKLALLNRQYTDKWINWTIGQPK